MSFELSQKKWLTDVQHGFRSKRSTTTSLLEFYEMVTETVYGQRLCNRHFLF